MHLRKAAFSSLAVALLVPMGNGWRGAAAQLASRVEAGALTTESDKEIGANVFSVAPSARYQFKHGVFTGRSAAWNTGQEWTVADAGVGGTVFSPTVYGVRADLIGSASRTFDDRSLGTDQVDIQTRIHVLLHERGGFWVGGGIARPWRVGAVSSVDVSGMGAWTRVGDATVSTTYTNFSVTRASPDADSMAPHACSGVIEGVALSYGQAFDPAYQAGAIGPCTRHTGFSDLETVVRWERSLVQVTAQGGYRLGGALTVDADSRRWAAASITTWITSRLALVVGGGSQPAMPMRGIPARSFASMGMMLASAPVPKSSVPVSARRAVMVRSFEVRPAAHGMQKITVRIGGVESVEVAGDFSDWNPLMLVRRGRDLWELTVPLEAGIHQINIRIDGGRWLAPPGMPTAKDGFNGEVGLLIVSG